MSNKKSDKLPVWDRAHFILDIVYTRNAPAVLHLMRANLCNIYERKILVMLYAMTVLCIENEKEEFQ